MQASVLQAIENLSASLANAGHGGQIGGFIIAFVVVILFASSFVPVRYPIEDEPQSDTFGDWPHVEPSAGGKGAGLVIRGSAAHSVASSASVVEGDL